MSFKYAAVLAAIVLATPALATDDVAQSDAAVTEVAESEVMAGDVEAGKKTLKKCKSCHTVANGDNVIYKGGKTGPNLYGVIGRTAGTYEGFKYGKSLVAAGEQGLVWDAETLTGYVTNPKKFLAEYLDDSKAKSKMSFKLKKGGEDVAAFLASVVE